MVQPEPNNVFEEPRSNLQSKRKAIEETNEGMAQKKRQRKEIHRYSYSNPQVFINESDGLVNLNITQEEIQEAQDLLNKSISLLEQNDVEAYKIVHEQAEKKLFSIAGRSKDFFEKYVKTPQNPNSQINYNPVPCLMTVSSPTEVNQEQPKSPIEFQPSEPLFSTNTYENQVDDDSYIIPRQLEISYMEFENLSNEEFFRQTCSTPALKTGPPLMKYDAEQTVPKQNQVMTMKVFDESNQSRISTNMNEKENQSSPPCMDVFPEQGFLFNSLHLRLLAQRLCLNEQFLK